MYARILITMTLVASLLVGTAVVGAASPADYGTVLATDSPADGPASTDGPASGPGEVGPDGGLPGPVPEFVSDVLGTIDAFLNGAVDSLGESLADLLGASDATERDGAGPSN